MNRKTILLLAAGLVIVGIGVAAYLTLTKQGADYYDPGSKQTVSTPPGKTPENFGRDPDQPIFLGVTSLLDHGVTDYQLNDYKYAVSQYGQKTNQKISEASISIDSVHSLPAEKVSGSPRKNILEFDLKFNRKDTYKAHLMYYSISNAQLTLKNKNGEQVFDSGVLDVSQGTD